MVSRPKNIAENLALGIFFLEKQKLQSAFDLSSQSSGLPNLKIPNFHSSKIICDVKTIL